MADETLVDACERYLSHKGCTLWGRAWDIIRPKSRREAAEWLASQVEAVQAELDVSSTNEVASHVATWQTATIVSDDARAAILANPRVKAGIDAYMERYARHAGNIPTITAEEHAERIANGKVT